MGRGEFRPGARLGAVPIAIAIFAALWLGAGTPSASAAEPFSAGCPKKILEEGIVERVNHNPRANHALVPSGAVSIRLCRYYGFGEGGKQTPKTQARVGELRDQVELRGGDLLESLALEFAELESVGKGTYNCPFDEGARLFAVFSYTAAKPVVVEINLSGCQFAYNGATGARFMTESLRSKLERLLEGHRRQAPVRGEVHKKVAVAYPPAHLRLAVAKHRLTEYGEEGCEGKCTAIELRHCRRKSAATIACQFVGHLAGEVCRANVSVTALEGSGYELSALVDDKQCPADLFTPPEVREHLEEIEAEEAEEAGAASKPGAAAAQPSERTWARVGATRPSSTSR